MNTPSETQVAALRWLLKYGTSEVPMMVDDAGVVSPAHAGFMESLLVGEQDVEDIDILFKAGLVFIRHDPERYVIIARLDANQLDNLRCL